MLVTTYFWTPQIAPDYTIFVKNFQGEHAPGPPPPPPPPPRNSVCTQCYRAIYTPAIILLSFQVFSPFKGFFEKCLSDIYLLDLTEVKQVYRH